jgi:hypothetical protein
MNRVTWRLARHAQLCTLPYGGCLLIELDTLACHELLDEAGALLRLPAGTNVALDEPHRQFLTHARVAGWIAWEEESA